MTGIKLTTGASDGYVLTSDTNGVGTWKAAAAGGGLTQEADTLDAVLARGSSTTREVTFSGTFRAARILTVAMDTGGTLFSTDEGKTITVNSGSTQTVTLPSAASDIGAQFTIVKLGAGQVTVQAAGGDKIADSSIGGSVYDDVAAETYANITVQVAKANQWVIVGGHGTWTTQ